MIDEKDRYNCPLCENTTFYINKYSIEDGPPPEFHCAQCGNKMYP